jgi:hypothetical protein
MLQFYEQIFDIPVHADATSFAKIVPFDVNTRKLVSRHVELDPMIFFEKIEEVVEVVDPDTFDTEVVYDQAELNWAPFVPPKSWCGHCFIIPFDNKAQAEEIVREDPGLGKAVAALAYFEIYPAIAVTPGQFVFLYELRQNVRDFDPDIFRIRHWSVEIEVFEVNTAKVCTLARENTVE